MATSTKSRKVQQIRANPRVVLYYADHTKATGSVTLSGRAELVEDMAEVQKRKRAYWDQSFPGLKNIVLIKVVPERLEVLNYKAGLNGDPVSFETPGIDLVPAAAKP
jgi:general stress protein 26